MLTPVDSSAAITRLLFPVVEVPFAEVDTVATDADEFVVVPVEELLEVPALLFVVGVDTGRVVKSVDPVAFVLVVVVPTVRSIEPLVVLFAAEVSVGDELLLVGVRLEVDVLVPRVLTTAN